MFTFSGDGRGLAAQKSN